MPNINKNIMQATISKNDQMIFSIEELKSEMSLYKINKLVSDGILRKLNKKFYENVMYKGDVSDFYYSYAYVPGGVICLFSAAAYYNLTTYIPDAVDVAIKRKSKVSTLPDWPAINLHYYIDERYALGAKEIKEGKNKILIYDVEKNVVDIVFYREKVGVEEMKEILTNYLHRQDRDLNKLIRYSESMKCSHELKQYLEVLI